VGISWNTLIPLNSVGHHGLVNYSDSIDAVHMAAPAIGKLTTFGRADGNNRISRVVPMGCKSKKRMFKRGTHLVPTLSRRNPDKRELCGVHHDVV